MNAPPTPQALAAWRASASHDSLPDLELNPAAALACWKRVFECMPCAMMLLDAQQRIVQTNAEAGRLLHLEQPELGTLDKLSQACSLEDTLGQRITHEDMPGIRTLLTGRPEKDRILKQPRAAGQFVWLSFSAERVNAEDEAPLVLISFTDVTDCIEGERARMAEWRELMNVIQGNRLGLWHSFPWEQKLHLDAQAASLMGLDTHLPPEDLMQAWARAIHPEDRDRVWEAVRRHLDGRQSSSVTECRVLCESGDWRWLRTRTHSLKDLRTGRVSRLAGTVEDVSELKTIEEAVQHSKDLLEALFKQAPMGIQLLDLTSGRTVMCNQALADITGTTIEHLLRHGPNERSSLQTAERRKLWRRELQASGVTGPHEFAVRRSHQTWREVRASAVRVYDPQGRPFAWAVVQDITEAKAHEAQLKVAATRDRLTGLPNRSAVLAHMKSLSRECAADGQPGFATLFLDFDRFKLVNDTLGHAIGDELLTEIADRLRATLPGEPGWMCARLGGDEFVITAPNTPNEEALQGFLQRLLEALSPAYVIGSHELHSSASVGVSLSGCRHADTETLLREADIAMYEAKRRGRAQVVFFGAEMDARIQRSVMMENGLRHAIARSELTVVYQPIVDLNDRQMVSAEALVRWSHPGLGQVSPAEFIPVAEESGHILAIGEWVLREACLQWLAWNDESPEKRPYTVSVNLSRVQLAQGQRLIQRVQDILAETGMPARHLQLEVTEREVMATQEDMVKLLRQLHDLGIKLAMDDFGTGASSLGCMRDLPFDVIKIDKSFIVDLSRDMQALAIAQATVSVIENLGMRSVAEGVESPDDVSVLQALGCQYGQGYLFCRPVPGQRLLGAWS